MPQAIRPSLRERKKAQTRRAIQEAALRLFREKGYDSTSVAEISAAAGVSHMTFFRYFPTKEDVVFADEYDPMLESLIAAQPTDLPAIERIRRAAVEGLSRLYAADREVVLARMRLVMCTPALRARLWEQSLATERWLMSTLAGRPVIEDGNLTLRVAAAAALATISTALLVWVERDGADDLPALVDRAFTALREAQGGANG